MPNSYSSVLGYDGYFINAGYMVLTQKAESHRSWELQLKSKGGGAVDVEDAVASR